MIISCSGSKLNYGIYCNLSCDYNLPLEGSSTIMCDKDVINGIPKGDWDWRGTDQPYCRGTFLVSSRLSLSVHLHYCHLYGLSVFPYLFNLGAGRAEE